MTCTGGHGKIDFRFSTSENWHPQNGFRFFWKTPIERIPLRFLKLMTIETVIDIFLQLRSKPFPVAENVVHFIQLTGSICR